ncbi:MAG TPA: 16S rRNA (cytidine(1402)-2'-O)-methyltransferase [Candidatus Micrarchaeia archaeon]|nr:16S rRNA (cytidine(1402)-2'-O)-methyltransferase [Candidatus Micrarchaeia archaeon]
MTGDAEAGSGSDPGTLFVVATPIGNLGDLSPRAAAVLARVQLVVAEDTRRTRPLLTHLGIHVPCWGLPAPREARGVPAVLQRLRLADVALVSDAGTPTVSDPGQRLVAAARAAGHEVVSVPGPCAAVTALAGSGLPADRFVFLGFLPRGPTRVRRAVAAGGDGTVVFHEAARRLARTLTLLAPQLGRRPVVVARELTKLHESWAIGTGAELAARFTAAPPRGECTVVVGPEPAPTTAPP